MHDIFILIGMFRAAAGIYVFLLFYQWRKDRAEITLIAAFAFGVKIEPNLFDQVAPHKYRSHDQALVEWLPHSRHKDMSKTALRTESNALPSRP
jgi:hypothetical protein